MSTYFANDMFRIIKQQNYFYMFYKIRRISRACIFNVNGWSDIGKHRIVSWSYITLIYTHIPFYSFFFNTYSFKEVVSRRSYKQFAPTLRRHIHIFHTLKCQKNQPKNSESMMDFRNNKPKLQII